MNTRILNVLKSFSVRINTYNKRQLYRYLHVCAVNKVSRSTARSNIFFHGSATCNEIFELREPTKILEIQTFLIDWKGKNYKIFVQTKMSEYNEQYYLPPQCKCKFKEEENKNAYVRYKYLKMAIK